MSNKYQIPKITDERLEALSKQIKPLVRRGKNQQLYLAKKCDPRNAAYTWVEGHGKKVGRVEECGRIRTLHTWSYYGFFKPSVAEVLSQIPDSMIDNVVAFECNGPRTAEDLNKDIDALNAGVHIAETILYSKCE